MDSETKSSWSTVVSLAVLAYAVGTVAHEVGGHAVACVALDGRLRAIGAFYVDCDYAGMSSLRIRLVALAGPAVSLAVGLAGLGLVRRARRLGPHAAYACWLLGTLGVFTSTGYALFSGVTGIGDFGGDLEGVFYGVRPEWLWRVSLAVVGAVAYERAARWSARSLDAIIGGEGAERVARARRLALVSYVSGSATMLVVGAFNPEGLWIVVTSAAASTLGGTSGLLWMTNFMGRAGRSAAPPLVLDRSWPWIVVAALVLAAYAVGLGPTLVLGR